MKAVKQERVEISKQNYDQMSLEIFKASESLWEGSELQDCYDAIQLEKLWPILDKYLKLKKDGKISA